MEEIRKIKTKKMEYMQKRDTERKTEGKKKERSMMNKEAVNGARDRRKQWDSLLL